MTRKILEVKDLKTYFFTRRGIAKAVDGVSFSLTEGETLGLVGESGCGKTVTSLSILRLVPEPAGRIVGGEILFEDKNLLTKSEKEMREIRGKNIAMILQDPMTSLNPVLTIGDQVAAPIKTHQKPPKNILWEEVMDMLGRVRIPSPKVRVREYPHQMSGGMRQRIVGAIAISCQPKLLIADEPTTALDVTIQAQFLRLLKEIQGTSNLSLILVTHDFGIVAKVCDRVAVMYSGKIVESASTRELFNHPAHPYTVALMKSLPKLDQEVDRLYSIEGQPPDLCHMPQGCAFAPRCALAMDVCRLGVPPQTSVSVEHYVSCWAHREGSPVA
jgi:oligopeptide/dipeptide ABC transporter ATP-binding protein